MGHYPSSPTGGTGPLRAAVSPIATFSTSELDWTEHVIDLLLNYEDVIVDNVLIEGCKLNPRAGPVWAQVRRLLAQHGVRTPVIPPSDEEWWGRRR
jgi:hypothetical protein